MEVLCFVNAKEFWRKHGDILRRGSLLTQDLERVGADMDSMSDSKATKVYTDALEDAGADKSGLSYIEFLITDYAF